MKLRNKQSRQLIYAIIFALGGLVLVLLQQNNFFLNSNPPSEAQIKARGEDVELIRQKMSTSEDIDELNFDFQQSLYILTDTTINQLKPALHQALPHNKNFIIKNCQKIEQTISCFLLVDTKQNYQLNLNIDSYNLFITIKENGRLIYTSPAS